MAMAVAALPSLSKNSARIGFLHPSTGVNNFGSNYRRPELVVFASSAEQDSYSPTESSSGKKKQRVDTRIHWDNPDEGWIGLDDDTDDTVVDSKDFKFGDIVGDILLEAENSHYQFLEVPPNADIEEIKAAYRRLSKEYHPDSTSLPLETASKKFVRLREAYDVLSRDDVRQFYDWSLAQETSSRQAVEKFKQEMKSDLSPKVPFKPTPDLVDRLGGQNIPLSAPARVALTFDAVVFLFTIGSIIYALYFKSE